MPFMLCLRLCHLFNYMNYKPTIKWIFVNQYVLCILSGFFDISGRVTCKLSPRMTDWTKDEVKLWLVQIGLQEATANHFDEVDGKEIERFTEEDLVKSFNLKKGELRTILYSRHERLEKERVAQLDEKVKGEIFHTGK